MRVVFVSLGNFSANEVQNIVVPASFATNERLRSNGLGNLPRMSSPLSLHYSARKHFRNQQKKNHNQLRQFPGGNFSQSIARFLLFFHNTSHQENFDKLVAFLISQIAHDALHAVCCRVEMFVNFNEGIFFSPSPSRCLLQENQKPDNYRDRLGIV